LDHIWTLLNSPSVPITALQLTAGPAPYDPKKADPALSTHAARAAPILDSTARKAIAERQAELAEELATAEEAGDIGAIEELLDENGRLHALLGSATGIAGRDRGFSDEGEKARVNVQRNIRRALNAIGKHSPALKQHLDQAITAGYAPVYDPTVPIAWRL
jgi:hypothetical protein